LPEDGFRCSDCGGGGDNKSEYEQISEIQTHCFQPVSG
jgi:hypothetical protein